MKDVIVFGHGRYFKSKETDVKKRYHIVAFIDNAVKNTEKAGDNGIAIYNPSQIDKLPKVPVLIMSAKYFEMADQLIRLGVDDERIYFGTAIIPCYDSAEELLRKLNCQIKVENQKVILIFQEKRYEFDDEESFKRLLRKLAMEEDPYIKLTANMPLKPISRRFGLEYGKAVDRYYIEKFLCENKQFITGDVMEIADGTYTNMFGGNVKNLFLMHVGGWGEHCIKGNLETGEGIPENRVDCFICTQTIQFIYDVHSAVRNIYKMLKPGGVALVTAHCLGPISLYDYYNWGEYWRFTDMSMRRLFSEVFDENRITVQSWGSMKTAIAYQYGLCAEELCEEDFEFQDEQYPIIVTAMARK